MNLPPRTDDKLKKPALFNIKWAFFWVFLTPKRIYNTLVMMLYLMDKISPDHHWRKRLIERIDQHQIDTTRMGFPADWKTKAIWR